MEEKMDEMKGRAKEAAGAVTGDEDLKREGKIDQAGATAKEKFEKAKDKLDETVDRVKDELSDNQ